MRINKQSLLFLILFIFALLSRVLWLGQIPVAFSHDEMGYLINAASLAKTGVGKDGQWSSLSLTPVEPTLAELPALLMSPFYYFGFSQAINFRLLFVFISLTIPIFTGLIAWKLFHSKYIAYFSVAVGWFNPWFWQNGRMTFDASLSIWFYLLGIYLFLRGKKASKLWSLVPLLLGFYNYQGMKLLLVPLSILLVIYWLFESGKFKLTRSKLMVSSIFLGVIFAFFGFYLTHQFFSQANSQQKLSHQLLTPNTQMVLDSVNAQRRLSLQTPINQILINKYTQFVREVLKRVLLSLNPRDFFLEIDAAASSFAVWQHGFFYFIDFILLFLGIFYLTSKKYRRALFLIVGLILIGILPSAINRRIWTFFRVSFTFPFIVILVASGLTLIKHLNKKLFYLTLSLYGFSVIYFGFIYFVRYPVFSAENIFYSPKLLSYYIIKNQPDTKVVVFENEPEFLFSSYVLYSNAFNNHDANLIQDQFRHKEKYEIDNFILQSCVPNNLQIADNTVYVFDPEVDWCKLDQAQKKSIQLSQKPFRWFESLSNDKVYIKSIKDSGNDFIILQDKMCQPHTQLSTFIHPTKLNEFHLGNLTPSQFCQTWITQPLAKD